MRNGVAILLLGLSMMALNGPNPNSAITWGSLALVIALAAAAVLVVRVPKRQSGPASMARKVRR